MLWNGTIRVYSSIYTKVKKMLALVLAGGIGKRMYPLTKAKCLLKFMGAELIRHKLQTLRSTGVDSIVIIAGPDNIGVLRELLGDEVGFAVQEEPLGMADAIMAGAHLCKGQDVLIINAEDIVEAEGIKELLKGPGDSRLLGYGVGSYFPGGYFILDGDRITGMVEKPGEGNEPSDLVSIGVYYHRKFDDLLEYMNRASSSKDDVYEVAMDMMMKDGYDFRAVGYSGPWQALKYPWHILTFKDYFLSVSEGPDIHPTARIHETAIIEGKVMIGEGTRVFEHAVIRGPCYIGKGSIIGNNSLVWGGCHLGKGNVVGYSTELKNVYTGDNVWFHQNYVGDSVIMDNCSLGAKCTTANFRFDEKNMRIRVGNTMVDTGTNKLGVFMGEGCRTGIMSGMFPGVRMGAGTFIGPGVIVERDVEKGQCIFIKQEHTVFHNWISVEKDRSGLMEKIGKKA